MAYVLIRGKSTLISFAGQIVLKLSELSVVYWIWDYFICANFSSETRRCRSYNGLTWRVWVGSLVEQRCEWDEMRLKYPVRSKRVRVTCRIRLKQ